MSHDREILDSLSQLKAEEYSGTLWRTSWKTRNPLQAGIAGGRWSPKSTIGNPVIALYTSLEKNTSITELHYHLSQAPVFSSCAMVICKIAVENIRILDLSSAKLLTSLNIDLSNRKDTTQSQKLGDASQFLGHQGIIIPCFRTKGTNCVLFLDTVETNQIKLISKQEINWPAWIKSKKV